MSSKLRRINLGVNCYLLQGETGFVLVDTGPAFARRRLVRELELVGCRSCDLNLVVITHADADHIGNCNWLREHYDAKLAAHEAEAEALRTGSMEGNRKQNPDRIPWFLRLLIPAGKRFANPQPVEIDILLEDGGSLAPYGLDASIVHLPGHSKGSIGVLTGEGDLVCGDLLWNVVRPRLHPFIDDLGTAKASLEKIRSLPVKTIHPGHGRAFPIEKLP